MSKYLYFLKMIEKFYEMKQKIQLDDMSSQIWSGTESDNDAVFAIPISVHN